MEFDNFLQTLIELNLSVGREFVATADHFSSKIGKILFNILNKCNQKMANTKINDQKCDEYFQNAKEKQQLICGSQHIGGRCPPIERQSELKCSLFVNKYVEFELKTIAAANIHTQLDRIVGMQMVLGLRCSTHNMICMRLG